MLLIQTADQALAGVVLPSGAGTLTIGPQAMEGNLQIHPGDTIKAGYDFTMPGAHAPAQVTVDNASITMAVTCSSGTTPPAITFGLPVQTYSDPAGSPSWYPSGDQSSPAVYQGSVIAPDLCAGGVMSNANGATFSATIFSTDTTDRVNFRFHYSDNTAGSWSATITASPTPTAKTLLTATLTPSLGLTLAVDHSSAIPGDTLTYSGTVTNTGATLTLTGDFTASASGSSTATVMSYWDDVATSLDSTTWTALAGTSAAQSGYTPAVTPPISSGMTLTSTPVAATGVTYPTSGDQLLGTTLASGSSALWHYTASVPLTPSQVMTLLDPTKVKAVQNSFHLEVAPTNPNITQPSIVNVDFSGIFLAASPAPSGAVTNVTVTVQPPTGAAVTINSATVAGLASLAPGGSANYSTTYKVPVPAAKGTSESDAAYQARLTGIEGSSLSASASASAGSSGGTASATAPAVSTTEHLPIISITKSGPSTPVTAGTSATYPLVLKNNGGATASGFTITDTVPSGGTGTVSGTPPSLPPGASSTGVQATYAVPGTQTPGNLTDTASVSWKDANGNGYGPVSSSFTTVVQNPLLGARLILALATGNAGLNVINAMQGLQLTLLNSAGAPIANQSVTINVTGSNPTTLTAVTDSNGLASASYGGKTSGTDQLQATATSGPTTVSSNTVSVTWIQPIQPISTTPVQGNFYAESANAQTFVAKPGDPAAFQQTFPTINFNPPANTVAHNVSGVGPTTTPFTDVTTDAVGNFAGTIIAQGNGVQAGVGTLTNFDAVLTANFVVSQPQDVTFNIIADDGFILGVGGGASRVSGTLQNPPASGLTAFSGYQALGAYNIGGATAPATYAVTIHFPSAGAYPYELDYFECCGSQLSLTMTVVSVNTGPYSVFTGYADTLHPAGSSTFPFPWNGAANTTFVGGGSPYDTGGLRFDNNTNQPITLSHVTVDIGTHHYDPWNLNLSLPANGTLVLANPSGSAFDTSEANPGSSTGSGGTPSGFTATTFASGFPCCAFGASVIGLAQDAKGNLFSADLANGTIYKFSPQGGSISAATILGTYAQVFGLAFSSDLNHLFLSQPALNRIVEIDQTTGAIIRTVASGFVAGGIATDRISGDIWVSQGGGGGTVYRVANPLSASPTVTSFGYPFNLDGIAVAPDGTAVYLDICCGNGFLVVGGSESATPGQVIKAFQSNALGGTDGIAFLPPPPGLTTPSVVQNSNNGVIYKIDDPLGANPTITTIFSGGTRGDFVTVGTDGCLYATQQTSVLKVTASDGSCPFIPFACPVSTTVPQVHVTINGFTFDYNDTGLALNSGGVDGECKGTNESQAWQQIGGKGGPVNIPLPPAVTLALQAAPSTGHVVGQSQAFTVAAMDGAGHTVPNVPVQLGVFGANTQQFSATADANGTATFSYTGSKAGSDTVTATALISGLLTVSNAVPIQWTIPAPGGPTGTTSGPAPPSVVVTSPADGSLVSQPVPIAATIRAPPSSPINFWNVQYQNVSGGSAVTLASGTTTPPATLASFDPTALAAGTYAITASATTSAGGFASVVVRVIVGNGGGTTAQAPPTISAPSPADGSIVTKPVPITATITPPAGQTVASWSVSYQSQNQGSLVTIASGTGSPPATLATLDPTLLPNDTYAITVSAAASGGGIQTATTTVAVFGNLKLGRYVTTYQDLSVPVNGFQMQVRRTYDSIDKRVGDFGIGWHVELANFRVSANRQLGAGGWTEYPSQCIFGLCFYAFKTSAPHYVTVTFPDGHQEIFDFTPQGGAGILYWQGNAGFTARPGTGTTSRLEVAGDSSLSYDFAGNLLGSSGYFNPTRFKLTTHDARVLILDTTLGLVSATDRNGNSLSVDANGVHASNGQSIAYSRDGAGRITKITGPSNQVLGYTYSASGDLSSSTDPNNNTATYTYDASHNLLSVTGPAQTQPVGTFTYDSTSRIVSVTDALGNTTKISNNVAGQQQTIIDPLGKLTMVLTLDDLGDVLRVDRISGGQTLTTTATYDPTGRPLTRTDPAGHVWSGAYNAAGDVVSLGLPSGRSSAATYDANGGVTSFTDALGRARTYVYDGQGNLTSSTNAVGATESFTYDSGGHAISYTDGLGRKTTYSYDAAGRLVSSTDPRGSITVKSYDASARVLTQTDALKNTTTYTYDANGNTTSVADPLGNVTRYTYNGFDQMTASTDPAGKTTTFAYDAANRIAARTDPLGRSTKYAYDADSRLVSVTSPTGAVTSYAYDGFGRLSSQTDPLGRTAAYGYDGAGRLTSTVLPNGGVVSDSYDADGHLISETDAMGRTTTYGYDADGRQTTVTDPLNLTTTTAYDAEGRRTSLTDPLGNVTGRGYDAAGQLISVTDPLGRSWKYSYDAAGNQVSITDPLGHVRTAAFDANNRLVALIDPLARTTSYAYDAASRRTSVTLPSGSSTATTYDPRGLATAQTDPLNRTIRYTYDDAGQLVSMTDPLGRATTYAYDAAGRQTGIIDALGGAIAITFDAAGEQTSVTNPHGDVTKRTYDSVGNVATETNPAGGVTTNSYDLNSKLTKSVDPRGVSVTYSYDADGRQVTLGIPGGSIVTNYDSGGRRTTVSEPTGTTTYTYDAGSQVTSVAAPQGTLTYTYDGAGNRATMTMPGGKTVNYTYDAANQLTQLKDWIGNITTLTYNPNGSLSSVARPNSVASTYVYDAAEQLIGLNHDRPSGAITHDVYTYDANGNRTSFTSGAAREQYSFDALNRLTAASYANGDTQTFTYDPAGNRTSSTFNGTTTNYGYNAAGQLTSAGSTAFAYDAAGNVTNAGLSSFTWDYADRLASATVGGTTSSYAYNVDGVRGSTTMGTTTTAYLTDPEGGSPQVVDDGSTSYVGVGGGLAEQVGHNGTVTYPLGDALASIRQIADSTGAVVGNSSYDVYGGVRTQSGVSSIFGFTGQQTDPTGLLFLRARYLDPTLGRFLSSDTVQPNAPGTQGFDAYTYVAGRPTTDVDPDGHFAAIQYAQNLARNTLVAVRALVPIAEGAVTREQLAQCIVIATAAAVTPAVPPVPSPCAKAGALIRLFLLLVLALAVATIPSDTRQPGTGPQTGPQPLPVGGTPSPPNNRRRGCGAAGPQDLDYLKGRAVEVLALKTVWYQTVADLRTYELASKLCIDIVGAGKSNLNQAQKANVIAHNEIPVTMADRHAEVTVLNNMLPGTIPLLLGVSQPVCMPTDRYTDTCRLDIQNNGGQLTPDQQGAIFPANIAIMLAGG